MENKSPLVTKASDFLDSRLVKVPNFEDVAADLDRKFELVDTEQGQLLVRKDTQQVISGSLEDNLKTILRPHVSDRSFGNFRSQFSYKEPDADTKGKVKSMLNFGLHSYRTQADQEEVETKILKNFIPDGNQLRPITKDGLLGRPRTVDEVIQHYAADKLNPIDTELQRLEFAAQIREQAQRLGANQPKQVERIEKMIIEKHTPAFEVVPHERIQAQEKELEKKGFAFLNIFDPKAATLAETNQALIKAKVWKQDLDNYMPWVINFISPKLKLR